MDALEFLKSYAVYHNSVGEPIFPASTNVFISNNGVTKAVEADEVTVDGANVNIGGCVWNGTAWDFTNAGQGGGGGSSGGGVLVVRADDDTGALNKTWQEIHDALSNGTIVVVRGPAVQAEFPASLNYIILADKGEGVYNIYFSYDNKSPAMTATSANGYPEWA